MYVEVSSEHWTKGKRKITYFAWVEEFDISDDLWDKLNKFAEEDMFSDVAKYDWQNGMIRLHRSVELDNIFKINGRSPSDFRLFHDVIQKEIGYIEITPMRYKYEYVKTVIAVDERRRKCVVEKTLPRKEFQKWIETHASPPPVGQYEVDISDRCIYEGIKPKDKVLIRKFLNDVHMAVYVEESYHEPTKEEMEQKRKDWEDLMGGY